VRIFDTMNDARVTWSATRKLTLEGGYGFRFTSFGDEPTAMGPVPIPGGSEHDLTLRGLFHVEHAGSAIAGYRGQIFVIGSGAQTHSPTVGYTRRLTELVTTEVEGGPMLYVQGAGGTAASTMPGAPSAPATRGDDLSTTWRARAALVLLTPHWRVLSTYDRDLVGGTGAAGVIWANFAAGSVRYRPMRWLDLTVHGDYFRNGLAPDQDLLVEGWDVGAELLTRIGRNLDLGAYYAYRDQIGHEHDAMPHIVGFTRNVVGLRLTALLTPTSRMAEEVQ
jgi:hypothetical protein